MVQQESSAATLTVCLWSQRVERLVATLLSEGPLSQAVCVEHSALDIPQTWVRKPLIIEQAHPIVNVKQDLRHGS